MQYGLEKKVIDAVKQAISGIEIIEKVVLYGSRAKGSYQTGSDIDITLFGKDLTLDNSVYLLMDELEELFLPYSFDISIFDHIEDKGLIEHIKRAGKKFYEKEQKI